MNKYIEKINNQRQNKKGDSEMHYQHFTGTPLEMAEVLAKVENCREFLQYQQVDGWIHEYITYTHLDIYTSIKYREYILCALIFVLDELNPLPTKQKEQYLKRLFGLLIDVKDIAEEEKKWTLDIYAAVALCGQILIDYVDGKIKRDSREVFSMDYDIYAENDIVVKLDVDNPGEDITDSVIYINPESDISALRQIIRNYSDDVIYEMPDPVFEWFFEELLDEFDGDEYEMYETHDMKELERKVRNRELLPKRY